MKSIRCDANERTEVAKWQIVLASVYAALVFFAYIQPFDVELANWRYRPLFNLLVIVGLLAPAFPGVMVVLRFVFRVRPSADWSEILAIPALLGGLVLTVLTSTVSDVTWMHGSTLTFAVAASAIVWAYPVANRLAAVFAYMGLVLSSAAAVWSLLSIPAVIHQANSICDGSRMCIAHHGPSPDIDSIWELRGFSFYTNRSGYKSTSNRHFHGIMTVDTPEGRQYYNWSPRKFRFDLIEQPERFMVPVWALCDPVRGFWSEL